MDVSTIIKTVLSISNSLYQRNCKSRPRFFVFAVAVQSFTACRSVVFQQAYIGKTRAFLIFVYERFSSNKLMKVLPLEHKSVPRKFYIIELGNFIQVFLVSVVTVQACEAGRPVVFWQDYKYIKLTLKKTKKTCVSTLRYERFSSKKVTKVLS